MLQSERGKYMIIKNIIIDFISSFAYVSPAVAYKLRIIIFFMHNFFHFICCLDVETFFIHPSRRDEKGNEFSPTSSL